MNISNNETIVIVGFGWVGQANALALSNAGYNVFYYDVGKPELRYNDSYEKEYSTVKALKNVTEKDGPETYYMVCVGDRVLPDGEQDISSIKKALQSLKGVKGTIILRSTIVPGHLASLDFDFYIPEFLHEKKAVEECMAPHYFILGTRNDKKWPSFFDIWNQKAVKVFQGTPEEASYIKYLSNIWNAMRIAFVNEFGNAIALPTNKDNLAKTEKIVDFFFERKSYLRYGRSYGGHCLPKDTHAFLTWHAKQGRNVSLLSGMHESNLAHRKLESENPHIPEWFSEWVRPQISGKAAFSALKFSAVKKIKGFFKSSN